MKAVFLDRDGVLIQDVGYLREIDQIQIIPGAPQALRLLEQHGFKNIVITNQSAVARGYLTIQKLEMIHEKLKLMFLERGARIHGIYYCPHHPQDNCECRKPKLGMIHAAARDFGLDISRCFLVGDKLLDIQTGKNAGCSTILVLTGYGSKERSKLTPDLNPDLIAEDIYQAALWIIK